ncbi:hypothetical protein LLH00_05955 [bacterium]|nr:hypothetical protein [bacterium]
MDYQKTANVQDGVDDAHDWQYNNLRAEVKAAVEGLQLGDKVDFAMTYAGGSSGDLLSQIVITDNQGDAGLDIDCTISLTYDGNDQLTQVQAVFGKLGKTLTETYTWTGGKITAVARTLS